MSFKVSFTDGGNSVPSYNALIDSYKVPSSRNNPFSNQSGIAYDSEVESLLGNGPSSFEETLCERMTACVKRVFCCCCSKSKFDNDNSLTTDSDP